ncbi:unnamed protein product [Gongylonema pulchrum]|uniref:Uncharacterized protein n=1 Tax=Gongylonema pulchrum TaxID=637853 RepID=A0A3P7N6F7_9BILA|nr:unnamed protein product [Gongylonema pulchrum]
MQELKQQEQEQQQQQKQQQRHRQRQQQSNQQWARTSGLRYFVNTSVDGLPEVVMVTAFSDNHFNEAIEMVRSFPAFEANSKLKGSDSQARTEGNCNVTDFLFFSDPGHSIFAATAYDTYRYLPSEIGMLKETTMLESNTMLFIRTQPVANILKWAVACALEKECMGLGSGGRKFELQCSFASDDHYRKYAHCHRFDQSVFNLLMANQYGFETRRYFKDGKNLFEIYRGASRIITAEGYLINTFSLDGLFTENVSLHF